MRIRVNEIIILNSIKRKGYKDINLIITLMDCIEKDCRICRHYIKNKYCIYYILDGPYTNLK